MTKKRVVLTFPHKLVDKPITYHLIKDYDLVVNIMRARVTPDEEGLLVIELNGEKKRVEEGLKYLRDLGVKVQSLAQDIKWDKNKCTHCTACVSICPTKAFTVDRSTMEVKFDKSKCIACELCVKACPYNAIHVIF
jgi:L-aspartate semialdehyde sulfurtransferase ferredoxin